MFGKYFEEISANLISIVKGAGPKDGAAKKGAKKKEPAGRKAAEIDRTAVRDVLARMIPSSLKFEPVNLVDSGGYVPEGVDLVAYREYFPGLSGMMDGAVPVELAYGAFFLVENLNRATLLETLVRVMNMKKLNLYTEHESSGQPVPAFVVCFDMDGSFEEMKEIIFNFYTNKNIDNQHEFDIIVVVNRGIIVKDWRQNRSFKAIVTGKDTMKWFFVLASEYLDVERGGDFDLRNYIRDEGKYEEY
jgi:hypothetical protein